MLMMGLVPFKEVHRLRALIECVDITTGLHLLIEVLLLVSRLATDRPTQDLSRSTTTNEDFQHFRHSYICKRHLLVLKKM